MSNPALLWNAAPPPLRQPRPGEPLFTLVKTRRRTVCELRYHGEYGVEAQFLEDGEPAFSRRFDTRAQAVQCAEQERNALAGMAGSEYHRAEPLVCGFLYCACHVTVPFTCQDGRWAAPSAAAAC